MTDLAAGQGLPASGVPVPHQEPEDPNLKLAYEEARAALKEQDATLGNFRTRATSVFGAASVALTLTAGVGLLNLDPDQGAVLAEWMRWPLVVVMVSIGMAIHVVLWPGRWVFGPSAQDILDATGYSINAVRRSATRTMIDGAISNDRILRQRYHAYRLSIALLAIAVLLLLVAIANPE